MSSGGYESWFLSARDPGSPRAVWIRHTRHRPQRGPESAAFWCTVADHSSGCQPVVVKQVFSAFPAGAGAGPRQVRGNAWLELVLARIRIGRARLPWTAMGALSLDRERIPLGGLGRRPRVDGRPGRLTANVPSPGSRLQLTVTTSDDDAVAVRYADPSGGARA